MNDKIEELLICLQNTEYKPRYGSALKILYSESVGIARELILHYLGSYHSELEGKIYAYEQIIAKSNFAPFLPSFEEKQRVLDEVVKMNDRLQDEIMEWQKVDKQYYNLQKEINHLLIYLNTILELDNDLISKDIQDALLETLIMNGFADEEDKLKLAENKKGKLESDT